MYSPLEYFLRYTNIYTITIFVVILLYAMYISLYNNNIPQQKNERIAIVIIIVLAIVYGLFPYTVESDKHNYARFFLNHSLDNTKVEKGWLIYSYICGTFLNRQLFFILTAFLYLYGFYRMSFLASNRHSILMMMGFLGFFLFANYATNTIRAGLAMSMLLIGLCYIKQHKNVIKVILFFTISFFIHKSMLLPISAILITKYIKNTKLFIVLWFLCIPISFIFGNSIQEVLSPFFEDFGKEDSSFFLVDTQDSELYKTYFRYDFILYSLAPIILGYRYIHKHHFKDDFYIRLFNTYALTNIIFILFIRSNFSDRLGYLSWVFIPILLLYPLLHYKIWSNQSKKISIILILQAIFLIFVHFK